MPQPKQGRRLGGTASHQKAILANLARAMIEHERIETTQAKAKEVQPLVDKLVGLGKRGDLHARRQVAAFVRRERAENEERDVIQKLFDEIAPRFAERNGGYTRIVKIGPRRGDAAPMVYIELV
ncbi:MAG: 50S ribosomal protein L17 [Alicyclobacillus shizuokensis]|nr:50S ribosomal protein L17 [Alicyclobacillus shizuokensis]